MANEENADVPEKPIRERSPNGLVEGTGWYEYLRRRREAARRNVENQGTRYEGPAFGRFPANRPAAWRAAITRLNSINAFIEYALHSVTQQGADVNTRRYDPDKVRNLPNIAPTITDADGYEDNGDRVVYYKRVRPQGGKPHSAVVVEFQKDGTSK